MSAIADIQRRLAVLERLARFSNKPIVGMVTDNNDPENRNRVKVSCSDLYGDSGESPWLVNRAGINGSGTGEVWTPKIGSQVSIALRNGSADSGEYYGGPRDEFSTIPEEFQDVNINGIKTESGIVQTYDDTTGDYSFETANDGKLILHQDGTMDIYGITLNVHSSCNLNSDNPQYGVVTASPLGSCPLFGPHRGSLTVKASD